jgi:hypothetical protein
MAEKDKKGLSQWLAGHASSQRTCTRPGSDGKGLGTHQLSLRNPLLDLDFRSLCGRQLDKRILQRGHGKVLI